MRSFLPHHAAPLARYIHRPRRELGGSRAPSFPVPRCMPYRPPDDPPTGSCRTSWNRPWKVTHGIVRTGRARGVRRSPFAIEAAGGAGERANPEEEPMHGKAATRRQRVRRTLARVFAGWRTGLPGPVLVLQAGTAVNYFGTGLILPFEIIYLHQARGFPTATAGLVLAAVMGTAAVVTPLSGALLDRFRAKPILITGNLASALGYAGFAFVDRPWQAFVCSAVGG